MATPNEQMLISSILKNNNLQVALKRGLNESMFYTYKDHYKWIEKYYLSRSKTPSMAAFHTKFRDFNIKVIDGDETEYFVGEVKEDHKTKSLYSTMRKGLELIEGKETDEALSAIHSDIMRISQELGLVNDGDVFRDHEDIMNEFAMRRERFDLLGASGVPSGFSTFDARTGGFTPGEFHVWAARPGTGKSWSMQKLASVASLHGFTVQFNALEQPRANVMARIISMISKDVIGEQFTSQSLIQGHGYDPLKFQKLLNTLRDEAKGKLHVADGTQGRISTSMVAAQIERNKPDIVFIDHISLMGRVNKDYAGVSEIADDLTQLANQYSIPIVAASQLNRQGAQTGSGLDTIAESDKIGQNASGVVFINGLSPRAIEYQVKKNRNGLGNFTWHAEFEPDKGVFKEVPKSRAKALVAEDKALAEEAEDDDDY